MKIDFSNKEAPYKAQANLALGDERRERIQGYLNTIIYHKDTFLIARLDNGIIIKGDMMVPQIALRYFFDGKWVNDPKYGKQFQFSGYQIQYPTQKTDIESYLSENCPGIGPAMASKLTDKFGGDTLKILREDPKRAVDVKGMTPAILSGATDFLLKNESNEKLNLELKRMLSGTGVTKRSVGVIMVKLGPAAPELIAENPYRLIGDIRGIGFLTADRVALKIGYAREGEFRVKAGILYVLGDWATQNGHTRLPESVLLKQAAGIMELDTQTVSAHTPAMIQAGTVVLLDGFYYLKGLYEAEKLVADKLKSLSVQAFCKAGHPDFDGLADDQKQALAQAVSNGVFILTGAPGVGKTFLAKRMVEAFTAAGAKVQMAAPTGKAAKRMIELSGYPASTIHKLLDPTAMDGKFYFGRNETYPLELDVIIVDEFSMVDIRLMSSLLKAVKLGTRLIFIGDVYQLPAVGPGNVLKDLITCGQIACVELTEIKRQDAGYIVRNCHAIKNGSNIDYPGHGHDFVFVERETDERIASAICHLIKEGNFDEKLGRATDRLRDIQIVTPLRRNTKLGCNQLNETLQELFLGPTPKDYKGFFRVGDKVIQTKNDYKFGVTNGDIGYVLSIVKGEITIKFDYIDEQIILPLFENDLQLAYAITCHKFQGSEAPVVIIPIHKSAGPLIMQRNWLYTAVSRAKQLCILVGQSDQIPKIIWRQKQRKRYTGLAEAMGVAHEPTTE